MKDTHFLYTLAALAGVGISLVFIGYATETLPMHTPKQHTSGAAPVTTKTLAGKKKNCKRKN